MLSGGKVTPSNAGYYQESVAKGIEDYYAGEGESPGRWFGRAEMIGAQVGAEVTETEARLLLEARSRPDGSQLGKTKVDESSLTAYDLTFSAPKSVSVLYALGNEQQLAAVLDAQTAAVEAAMGYLDEHAAFTRVGKAGAAVVDSDGLVGIRYRHRTSRAMNPQLHDHCLVANAVRTSHDGVWRTIDGRMVYAQMKAAGMLYQAALRAELTARLGVAWEPVSENGQADIAGIDQGLMAAWSTRGDDIESELNGWATQFEEREGRLPTPAEVGKAHKHFTLTTRDAKSDQAGQSTTTLREQWRAEAQERGVDVEEMIAGATGRVAPMVVEADLGEVLEAVEARRAEWGQAQVVEQIAARTVATSAAEVLSMVEAARQAVMASGEVVELSKSEQDQAPAQVQVWGHRRDGRAAWLPPSAIRFTTQAHLVKEHDVVAWIAMAVDPAVHRRASMANTGMMGDSLDEGQREAVEQLLERPTRVAIVVGPAGAGKTKTLAAAVDAWFAEGIDVQGLAPSARAAEELREGAAIPADTLAKLLVEHRDGRPGAEWDWAAGTVVIIDEAAMVSTGDLAEFSALAVAKDWRTVLVGDHHQLDSVDAGGMFAELVEQPDRTVPVVELSSVHRFHADWEKAASLQLRDHDTTVLDEYNQRGRLSGYETEKDAVGQVVAEAVEEMITEAGPEGESLDVLVMAPTRQLVEQLNERFTNELLDRGVLDQDRPIQVGDRTFYEGQAVVTRANERRIRLGYGTGYVQNGDRWSVVGSTLKGELVVRKTDGGAQVRLPGEYVEAHVEIGYASTIHRAQGATVDRAHLLISGHMSADALYVGMTRGRADNHVHVVKPVVREEHHDRTPALKWTPVESLTQILGVDDRTQLAALTRQRQLRDLAADRDEMQRRVEAARVTAPPTDPFTLAPTGAAMPAPEPVPPRVPLTEEQQRLVEMMREVRETTARAGQKMWERLRNEKQQGSDRQSSLEELEQLRRQAEQYRDDPGVEL